MGWKLLTVISLLWAGVVIETILKKDWTNLAVYGGILATNTGLAIHAL